MEEYKDKNGIVNTPKIYADLMLYKGFYEGIKTITNLLVIDKETKQETKKDDLKIECAFGGLDAQNAMEFKNFMDNLLKGE